MNDGAPFKDLNLPDPVCHGPGNRRFRNIARTGTALALWSGFVAFLGIVMEASVVRYS